MVKKKPSPIYRAQVPLYRAPQLGPKEEEVIREIEGLWQSLRSQVAIPRRWVGQLARNTFAKAIRGSNSIEGYTVSKDDAVAAVEETDPMEASAKDWAAVSGYRRAMSYVLQLSDDPHFFCSKELLRSLHYMILEYEPEKRPGTWRLGPVYVSDEQGKVVYTAPDAEAVPRLIDELVEVLNLPTPTRPPFVRAALSHLNLALIHPFADGNGRMARCLHTLMLARQGILAREFCSIEEYLGRNQTDYYAALTTVAQGRWQPETANTLPWVRFCLTAHLRQARTVLRWTTEFGLLWDRLDHEIQQRHLPERTITALSDAAFGYKVRNQIYCKGAEVSQNLASRDLKLLSDCGLLIPQGERRGRFYTASQFLRDLRESIRQPREVPDPFGEESTSVSNARRQPSAR